MREYDPNKDYKKYKVTYKHERNGLIDSDYIHAENENEARGTPLDIEEYELIEILNISVVNESD